MGEFAYSTDLTAERREQLSGFAGSAQTSSEAGLPRYLAASGHARVVKCAHIKLGKRFLIRCADQGSTCKRSDNDCRDGAAVHHYFSPVVLNGVGIAGHFKFFAHDADVAQQECIEV